MSTTSASPLDARDGGTDPGAQALPALAVAGGLCGLAGTLCYLAGVFLPLPARIGYGVVILWPVLSVVFSYALRRVIGAARDGACNQLAFVFACLAFATVAAMVSVQLAVRMGIAEHAAASSTIDRATQDLVRRAARLVDHGLDVAWDVFIGTSLMFLAVALGGDARFGRAWGAMAGVLGMALVILNVATFPWPPASQGLFDIGPLVGLFAVALSARLFLFGVRGWMPRQG